MVLQPWLSSLAPAQDLIVVKRRFIMLPYRQEATTDISKNDRPAQVTLPSASAGRINMFDNAFFSSKVI